MAGLPGCAGGGTRVVARTAPHPSGSQADTGQPRVRRVGYTFRPFPGGEPMGLDKQTANQLVRFAEVFRAARERGDNEANTVTFLLRFFEDVLGYDSLQGEVCREEAIKDRFCDLALKIGGECRVLVEVKAASHKSLSAKHIEQAENYAAHAGVPWVLLSNGIEWQLFHLTFNEGEGIAHDLVFAAHLLDEVESGVEALWSKLEILSRAEVKKGSLDDYWSQKKILSPASLLRVLFHEDVLRVIRRELRKEAEAMLDVEDVFRAVRDIISKEALAEAGDLGIIKRRKRRKKVQKADVTTGQGVEETVAEKEDLAAEVVAEPAVEAAKPLVVGK